MEFFCRSLCLYDSEVSEVFAKFHAIGLILNNIISCVWLWMLPAIKHSPHHKAYTVNLKAYIRGFVGHPSITIKLRDITFFWCVVKNKNVSCTVNLFGITPYGLLIKFLLVNPCWFVLIGKLIASSSFMFRRFDLNIWLNKQTICIKYGI